MTRTTDPRDAGTRRALCHLGLSGAGLSLLAACNASLLPRPAAPPVLFTLDDAVPDAVQVQAPGPRPAAPTLIVGMPRAAAGFDTPRIVYLRQPQQLDSYASSVWIDTPARMLAPLVARAARRSGVFRAVLQAPSAAVGDMQLETELIRLQHEFMASPSSVRLSLRAELIATATRRVVATREFDARATAPSDDPQGGVTAAHAALRTVLAELAQFCTSAALA